MFASIRSRNVCLSFGVQEYKLRNIQSYKFSRVLVTHLVPLTLQDGQTDGVRQNGAQEDIWDREGRSYKGLDTTAR